MGAVRARGEDRRQEPAQAAQGERRREAAEAGEEKMRLVVAAARMVLYATVGMLVSCPAAATEWTYTATKDAIHGTVSHLVSSTNMFGGAASSLAFGCEKRQFFLLVSSTTSLLGTIEYRIDDGRGVTIRGTRLKATAFAVEGGPAVKMFNEMRRSHGQILVRISGAVSPGAVALRLDDFAAKAAPVAAACGLR